MSTNQESLEKQTTEKQRISIKTNPLSECSLSSVLKILGFVFGDIPGPSNLSWAHLAAIQPTECMRNQAIIDRHHS